MGFESAKLGAVFEIKNNILAASFPSKSRWPGNTESIILVIGISLATDRFTLVVIG